MALLSDKFHYSTEIAIFLKQNGYNNIVVSELPQQASFDGSVRFVVHCVTCGKVDTLKIGYYETNGSAEEVLEVVFIRLYEFGHFHAHKEQPYLVKKDLSDLVISNAEFKPGKMYSVPKNTGNPIQFFSTEPPKLNGPITVSQAILKEVYKLSNFNVELQSKFKGATMDYNYRAICINCGAEIPINYRELGQSNYTNTHTWQNISVFCTEHTHEYNIEVATVRTGRRFK